MHCDSTIISSVVRSAFTNTNSPIGKNVRLCALYTVLVRELLDVGGLADNCLFGVIFLVCHRRFLRGRILCARPLLYVRARCCLVCTTLNYRSKNFLPLFTILRVTDMIDVANIMLLYMLIRIYK